MEIFCVKPIFYTFSDEPQPSHNSTKPQSYRRTTIAPIVSATIAAKITDLFILDNKKCLHPHNKKCPHRLFVPKNKNNLSKNLKEL